MAYLRLPDNSYFKIPEGSSPQEAYAIARQKYPEAFKAPEPKDTGFTGAFKSSVESLKGDVGALAGKLGIIDEEAAQKYVEEKKRAAEAKFAPTEEGWTEAPFLKARELLGGSLPYMAAPLAAGAATLVAPVSAPVATGLALGAAGLTSGAQFAGSNLQRQMDTGKTLAQTDLEAAVSAAIPQAALDTLSLRMLPGIGRIFNQAGVKITPQVAKQIAEQGTKQTLLSYGAQGLKTAGVEGLTEAGQQFFERLQAGLDIADPEARKEYFESFIGGAVLGGTLSVPGTAFERSKAKGIAREQQAIEDAKAAEENRLNQEAQEQMAAIAAEQKPVAPQIDLDQMRTEVFNQRRVLQQELDALRTQATQTDDLDAISQLAKQAETYEKALNDLDPENVTKQIAELNKALKADEKKLASAEKKGDDELATTLKEQITKNTATLQELQQKLPALTEAPKPEDIAKQIATTEKAMKKAIELGELGKAGQLAEKLKKLKEQPVVAMQEAAEKQPSLFEGAGEKVTYPEAERRETEQARALEEERPDLYQQRKLTPTELRDERTMDMLREDLPEQEKEEFEKIKLAPIGELRANLDRLEKRKKEILAVRPDLTKWTEKEGVTKGAPTREAQQLAAIDDAIIATKRRIEEEELGKKFESKMPSSLYELPAGYPSAKYNRFAERVNQNQKESFDSLTDAIFSFVDGKQDPLIQDAAALGKAVEAYRSSIVRNALLEAEARRRAEGRGPLEQDAAIVLATRVNDAVTEIINRVPALPRKQVIDQLGVAVEPRLITRGRPNAEVFAKRQKELSELRGTIYELEKVQNKSPATERRIEALKEREAVLEEKLRKDITGEGKTAFVKEKLGKITIDPRELAARPFGNTRRALQVIQQEIADAKEEAVKKRGKLTKELMQKSPKELKVERSKAEIREELGKVEDDIDSLKSLADKGEREEKILAALNKRKGELQAELGEAKVEGEKPAEPTKGISRLQKELPIEPIATYRANRENFMKFLGSKEVFKLREKVAAEARALATKAKRVKKQETFNMQDLRDQQALVERLDNIDKTIKSLRSRAVDLWNARPRLEKGLEEAKARKATEDIERIEKGLAERLSDIDAIYAQIDELKSYNIAFEKAVLRGLEKQAAKFGGVSEQTKKVEAELDKARRAQAVREAQEAKDRADRVKERRELEQAMAEAGQKAVSVKRETKVMTFEPELKYGQEKIPSTRKAAVQVVTRKTAQAEADAELRKALGMPEETVERPKKTPEAERFTVQNLRKYEANLRAQIAGLGEEIAADVKQLSKLEKQVEANPKDAEAKRQLKELRASMTRKNNGVKMDELKRRLRDARKIGSSAEAALKAAEEESVNPSKKFKSTKGQDYTSSQLWDLKGTEIADSLQKSYGGRADLPFKGDIDFRVEAVATGERLDAAAAQAVVDKIKVPKGLHIKLFKSLPKTIYDKARSQGLSSAEIDGIRGGVMPDGSVFIVADAHVDVKDLNRTIAHELIGHLGVEGVLGDAGMNALIKKIGDRSKVMALADKLGVGEEAGAAYAAVKRVGGTEEKALGAAVREMIAHTAETRPDKGFLAKANEFIKAMVGALRAALRNMGLDLDISTGDIYNILRQARKEFANTQGAYVNADGDIQFSAKPIFNDKFRQVANATSGLVYRQKPLRDRILGELSGLIFQTKYIDRFAPVLKVLDKARDSLKATQLMYYLRMHDQRMAWTSQIASYGPAILKKVARAGGGEEFLIETDKGANLKDIAEALRQADVGNHEATVEMFTKYLIAKRAKTVGLAAVNYKGNITQKMLDDVEAAVKADPKTRAAFEKAEQIYAEYNRGLINFAIQSGAIAKKDGEAMLKAGNYVPFYRVNKDNVVLLEIGGAPPIKIGNLQEQPYLHELVGGEEPIFDMFTSALQNTAMLTDMSLRNLATRNVAYTLADMGLLERRSTSAKDLGVYEGPGKLDAKTIRFKKDGVDMYAVVNTDAAGVEAELLVKGLQGVNTSLPNAVKMMNVPANLLRKWVTRNPAYALRQVVRDPLNAVMVSGANTIPVASSIKEIAKMVSGKSTGEMLLQSRGILGGQVFTGTTEDQRQIMLQIASGKKGWDYYMAKADQLAIQGDAATRVVMYNSFIKQGLSEMEATLATLEAMNFSKRGISPSLFALSTMVPFMNAQIQGLNVLYQAFAGKMPFNEKLKVKQKLIQRGLMMMGFSMIYAALMSDDEAYSNANMEERYGNWFVYTPFTDEPIKVPIPFELGWLFKAVPEGVVNLMSRDDKSRDVVGALGKMAWQSVPISMPQGIKPALELAMNHSFYTGRAIENERLQQFEPGERYTDRTSELAKLVGKALNVSPVKIEYAIKGYTGSLPIAAASLANPIMRGGEGGAQPEGRASELPLVGTFFQPKDAGGLVTKAYKDMEEINAMKATYKKLEAEGRYAEADAYLDANADTISMASFAGVFRQRMGELTRQEREVRSDPTLSAKEKREMLDKLKQDKIELAKELSSARG